MPISNGFATADEVPFVVKVLVTGANGFIGRHLARALLDAGYKVLAAYKPDSSLPPEWSGAPELEVVPLELSDPVSVQEAVRTKPDGIIHLAGVSYSQDATKNPDDAWDVTVHGTKSLLDAVKAQRKTGEAGPLVLVTSSAEVYGQGDLRPRVETDETRPLSVYAASKLGAEAAAAHAIAAWGLRVIVVRPFPATGPGQTNRLVPNWLAELRERKREIEGDPDIVRDFTDVRDTAAGYVALMARGRPGETYNIASGREVRFGELFTKLTGMLGIDARLVPPSRSRAAARYLVGDPRKLQQHTGWQATIPLEQTLADMIGDAQAN
jgi:GDP-4-dehydro-6-deoxy-D-mannose reductase